MSTKNQRHSRGSVVGRKLATVAAWVLVVVFGIQLVRSGCQNKPSQTEGPANLPSAAADEPASASTSSSSSSLPPERNPVITSPTTLRVEGNVQVSDSDGKHVPSSRGFVKWSIHSPSRGQREAMSGITQDRWSLDVSSDEVLRPTTIAWSSDVDTQYATPLKEEIPAMAANGYTLHAQLESGFVINVLDARTLAHVKDLSITLAVPCSEGYRDTQALPAVMQELGRQLRGDSPIVLPHLPGTRVGWVRAPGYAWRRFAFVGDKGELTVSLRPGADVDVLVKGLPPVHPGHRVHVYSLASGDARAQRVPWAELKIGEDGRAFVPGLPTGATEFVVVSTPGIRGAGPRLGEISIDLAPSAREQVVIDLASPITSSAYGSILAIVRGAQVAKSPMARIEIQGHGITNQSPVEHYIDKTRCEKDGSYHFRCNGLKAGEYVVSFQPMAASRMVRVEAGMVVQAEIDLAEAVPVNVFVVDPKTGTNLGGDVTILYRPSHTKYPAAWQEVEAGPPDNVFAFRCLPGPVTLAASGPARKTVVQDVVVTKTTPDIRLILDREQVYPIRLRALQGTTEVPLPPDVWTGIRVTPVGSTTGKYVSIELGTRQVGALAAQDAATSTYYVDSPGRYRLQGESVMGVAAPPVFEVDVAEGTTPELVFTVDYD